MGVKRRRGQRRKGRPTMMRVIKFLLILGLFGGLGVIGFAYLGNLTPEQSDVTKPVTLDAN
jgi:hypothetical protein